VPAPKAWALVDADTGNILDAGNDRTPLPPASLTKVITALTVTAAIPPDANIGVSARAEAAPADKMFMKQGQVWTFSEMIHSLLISSANDAAIALAERAGGSLEGFQPMFAATAAELGMADHPVLHDPAGLDGPDGVDGGNLVSARDLAMAARALLANPTLAAIVATTVYYFEGPDNVNHRLTNHNKSFLTSYPGAIGVKTGSTSRAGTCLIAAATRDGRTMLAVILDGANPNQTAKRLLDEGFATPVSAEPAADRLPPVATVGFRPPAVADAAPTEAAPAAPAGHGASVPAVAIRPARSSSGGPLSTVVLVAAIAASLVGLLRLRALSRRRRRRARRTPLPHR
jgi:D-alanyl-D-alanine carboxypeptidase